MSLLLAVAVLAFIVGYRIRAGRAHSEAEAWRARCALLKADRDAERAHAARNAQAPLPSRRGPDPWPWDALEAVLAAMAPGERAGCLTVQARWKDSDDEVLIGIERGSGGAERLMRTACTDEDGGEVFTDEEVDLPCPGSAQWVTGVAG
jgi:hypothetical protein